MLPVCAHTLTPRVFFCNLPFCLVFVHQDSLPLKEMPLLTFFSTSRFQTQQFNTKLSSFAFICLHLKAWKYININSSAEQYFCYWLSRYNLHSVIGYRLLSCVWLFCDPMNCSPPGSSVHRIFQARTLEWVAISSSRGSSWPRDPTCISFIEGRFFTTKPPGKPP